MNPSISTALMHGDGSVLCSQCAVALGVDDVAVVLDTSAGARTLWTSSSRVRRLTSWESSLGEGPCTDAIVTNAPRSSWLTFERPAAWPSFSARARTDGVRSAGATPIRLSGEPIGALALYGDRTDVVDARTVSLAGQLATVVAHAVVRAFRHRPDALMPPEQEILPQAVGMVAAQRDIGVDGAMEALRSTARDEGRPVEELAVDVVQRRRTLAVPR